MSEMDVFHISPVYNRNSILKNGIVPTRIRLDHHRNTFREDGVSTKDDKIIYAWSEHKDQAKIVRDLIYAITWIHGRNDMYDKIPDGESIDFRNDHRMPIYAHDQMVFDIYKRRMKEVPTVYTHAQFQGDIHSTCHRMHESFMHDDKNLVMLNKPIMDFELQKQQALFSFNKANKKFVIKML